MTKAAGSDFALEKALPGNIEAERLILGAILLDNTTINQAAERLKRDDFFLDSHRRIYDRMLYLSENGRAIDPITLAEELQRNGDLTQIGGPAYIAALFDGVPRFSNIESYVGIVKGKSMLRRLITTSNQIMASCFDAEDDPEEILDQAEKMILAIAEDRIRQGFTHISEIAQKQFEHIEDIAGRQQLITGIATGFRDLDYMTSGLQRGDLIIVAARPSMGKTAFSLNMAQNAALLTQEHGHRAVVGVFSLEMSKEQLVQRLMCSQARLDAHRLRSGMLSKDDWRRLAQAVGELAEADIYIDDTPAITTLELRAKARRLRQEKRGLDLLIVDYLQLMSGRGRVESRQQEVSQISRELKGIAKELNVPLIALSQLSRATETRTDHRPQLSDLRESGCLAGESLVAIADTGARVPIRELVGRSGFDVWALNEATMTLERASVSRAFATGIKPVFRLTTRLGRTIRATANHKFRTIDGWKRLDELHVGERLAMPRHIESGDFQSMTDAELALLGHLIGDGCTLPRHAIQYTTREQELAEQVAALATEVFGNEVEPRIKHERTWYQVYLSSTRHHTHHTRSAVTEWLMSLGVWGLRSYEKRVPEKVFEQPAQAIALFLRHLWATDGCVRLKPGFYAPAVYYASSSERLARDVQTLLLRLGINAWLRCRSQKGKGRDQFHVTITGKDDLEKFADLVGATGAYKKAGLQEVRDYLRNRRAKTNRDIIPGSVWQQIIIPAMQQSGITVRQLQTGIGIANSGSQLYQQNISRERAARIAQVVPSEALSRLAQSDVYWDEITSIEPDGEAEVFDLTVDEHHNFIANDFIPHNSIEQDADLVMFIYRDEVYHPETEKQNTAEIIIGKQRNGPIGTVELIFLKQLTRFENKAYEG